MSMILSLGDRPVLAALRAVPSEGEPTSAENIAASPLLRAVITSQAQAFRRLYDCMPRTAAIFATQQRYLMAQLALAMAFEAGEGGLVVAHFLAQVRRHGIASRNTAQSFVAEMLHYGLAEAGPASIDRRVRPIVLARHTIEAIEAWLAVHLESLDALDGGNRRGDFLAAPEVIGDVHPQIVRRLLASPRTTNPSPIFSLFTDMNDGSLAMDMIAASLGDSPDGLDRIETTITSVDALSRPLRITRAHLLRKLNAAERRGHIGWSGRRGASALWISRDLLGEYDRYQIDKLAGIAAAWHKRPRA